MVAVFALAYTLPFDALPAGAPRESLLLLQDYARHHVLLCLVPALFIAGAISVFISQAAVVRHLGAQAHRVVAYGVAAVSGTVLAACSCTVLPLFAGIYKRGAGLGPAIAFLYAGPAINVLAVLLTAQVLGWELGLARALGAVVFSVVLGVVMHALYRKEERDRAAATGLGAVAPPPKRTLRQDALFFAALIGVLVFANWGKVSDTGFAAAVWSVKWILATGSLALLLVMLGRWFDRAELRSWGEATWTFAKQILPLLAVGVLVAGLLLGRPGHPGLIPERWVAGAVGGNGVGANFFASFAGALMYFATLTEVPILQGLLGSGMGMGPALALLLAGPALSLPNMLVIRSVLGTRKTLVYVGLVVAFSAAAGLGFGAIMGEPR
jgi:uncharacterized membrane protein YraQ (UPF0718 family)